MGVACGLLALLALQGTAPDPSAATSDVARVLRGLRIAEPRFSGGFSHATCEPFEEKGRLVQRALCTEQPEAGSWESGSLARLRRRLAEAGRESPPIVRAGAILTALTGRDARSLDLAGEALESLVRLRPGDPSLLNDRAAVWYLRAVAADEPVALLQALDLLERAYSLAPRNAEIRFNRALVLDRLHLVFRAREAWEEVAVGEAGSGWAEEARAKIAILDRENLPERWRRAKLEIEVAALAGDQREVERLVLVDLQGARRFALEDLLGAWGDRYLAGGAALAERELRLAEAVGAAIERRTGEKSALDSAAVIRRALGGADRPTRLRRLDRLARGYRDHRDGQLHLEAQRTEEALGSLETARRFLAGAGDPLELWAACGVARAMAAKGLLAQAESLFRELADDPRTLPYSALRAWIEWGLGWVLGRQARIDEAADPVGSALSTYSRLQERENSAFVAVLSADHSMLLGRPAEAWKQRQRALAALREQPLSRRRHTLLMQATRAEENAARDWASLALQSDNLAAVVRQDNAIWKAEAHWSIARALLHLGRVAEGLDHMARARSFAREADPGAPRDKLSADLLLAEAEVLVTRDPDLAFADFDAALRGFRALGATIDVAVATLLRAEAALVTDRSSEAERDLDVAMAGFEEMARHAGGADARASYADSVQRAFDAMIDLQARDRRDPRTALDYLERAKRLAYGAAPETGPDRRKAWWHSAEIGPARGAVVAYALLEDNLLLWTISRGSVSFEERRIPRSEVASRVDAFVQATQRRGRRLADPGESVALADLLLPAALSSLEGGEPIVFVPDRELFRVPFAALVSRSSGQPLVARHPVSISLGLGKGAGPAPVAATLPSSFRSLLVGNPDVDRTTPSLAPLPGATEETRRAAELFGPDRAMTLLGRDATREAVLAEIGRRELFVFAGHSVSDADFPSRSHLFLTPSSPFDLGALTAGELEGKGLGKLRLVILSSCSSLGSRVSRSAGIAGIARPFAEGPGVVVLGTLWPVGDRGSSDFLLDFLRQLDAGRDYGTALWLAQKQQLERDRRSGSSDWLAYEMISAHL